MAIDPLHRQVVMRDNGIGVSNDVFIETMCAIGSSPKRGLKARGFRGIGRLVGLGYAQELVLRSRSQSGENVMEAVWDARLLRELLRSRQRAPLDEVVAAVVKITSREANKEEPAHFLGGTTQDCPACRRQIVERSCRRTLSIRKSRPCRSTLSSSKAKL